MLRTGIFGKLSYSSTGYVCIYHVILSGLISWPRNLYIGLSCRVDLISKTNIWKTWHQLVYNCIWKTTRSTIGIVYSEGMIYIRPPGISIKNISWNIYNSAGLGWNPSNCYLNNASTLRRRIWHLNILCLNYVYESYEAAYAAVSVGDIK